MQLTRASKARTERTSDVLLGCVVGWLVGGKESLGIEDGTKLGLSDCSVDGNKLGSEDGNFEGIIDGTLLGCVVGWLVVGNAVGLSDGGDADGASVKVLRAHKVTRSSKL